MLFDLYGELLTEHQKAVYGQLVNDDMSLSELAEQYGISRQGVHDLIRRCDRILEGYEEKLHLLEKKLSEPQERAERKAEQSVGTPETAGAGEKD